MASSGRADRSIRRSAVSITAALAPNRSRNHQPTNGAMASSEIPQVAPAMVRAVRTRAFASSARAL